MEVIVALVILAVVMAGLVNLFISGKRWIIHLNYRMAGGELGRQFLDPLQMQVRQDQWVPGGNCLTTDVVPPATTNCGFALWEDPVTHTQYTPRYAISPLNPDPASPTVPLGDLRRVVLTITWFERDPNL
ncbi:MAG: hypothetical protein PHN59_01815 [Candidatus Omnitrophica bacterium]|nr:hypothetical protein [Candidatus Omnitrophota bacterium]